MSDKKKFILQLFVLVALVSSIGLLAQRESMTIRPLSVATTTQSAAVPLATNATSSESTTSVATSTDTQVKKESAKDNADNTAQQSQNVASQSPEATRIDHPYESEPMDFSLINTATRAALVNIFCTPHGGTLHPISGSGVIIDPRGVILTNAHVAQYVLLSQSPQINLTCSIRTGSPAVARYKAEILYIPKAWIDVHASEINDERPLGTGEHDYALLHITGSTNGAPLPASFPAIEPDSREAIAFVDDNILGASYPAEFAAGSVQNSLYPVSSITQVNKLYTFGSGAVDVISIGSAIEAQSGSSGGPMVNAWNKLVGIITTTSEGATTGERQLRGVTLSYIDRDLAAQTGQGLTAFLSGDIALKAEDFTRNQARDLIATYIPYLAK